jgi:hypothetical protein
VVGRASRRRAAPSRASRSPVVFARAFRNKRWEVLDGCRGAIFFRRGTSVTAVIAEIRTNLLPRSFEADRVARPGCRSCDRGSVSRPRLSTCSVSASCGRCFDAVPEPATRALYDRLHLQPGSVLVDAATEASTRAPTPPPPGRSRRSPSARGFERTGLVTSLAGINSEVLAARFGLMLVRHR